jgi:uncharacterized protein HemX
MTNKQPQHNNPADEHSSQKTNETAVKQIIVSNDFVKAKSRSLNKWSFILLLIIIVSIIGNGYYIYRKLQHTNHLLLAAIANNNQLQQHLNAQAKFNLDGMNKLKNGLDTLSLQVSKLNDAKIKIFQLNQLITLANQSLLIYNDVQTCMQFLKQAQSILDNNPNFVGLRIALSQDLSQLNHLPIVDVINLNNQLDQLYIQIGKLQLSSITANNDNHQQVANNLPILWRMWLDIKLAFTKLVVVSKPGVVDVLVPQQKMIIDEAIQINILNARLALSNHDNNMWVYNINALQQIITSNFSGYIGNADVLNLLNDLMHTNITKPNITIDNTLQQLTKLNNLY